MSLISDIGFGLKRGKDTYLMHIAAGNLGKWDSIDTLQGFDSVG
jgi:hypothetical protein